MRKSRTHVSGSFNKAMDERVTGERQAKVAEHQKIEEERLEICSYRRNLIEWIGTFCLLLLVDEFHQDDGLATAPLLMKGVPIMTTTLASDSTLRVATTCAKRGLLFDFMPKILSAMRTLD